MNELAFHPLTSERWPDFERLFGPNGAYGGCWCMWWRLSRKQFEAQQGEGNRQAMQALVESGDVPGILAYSGTDPIGWCSVAPRHVYASLNRSPVLKPLDDRPVWSMVCFYVARAYRGRGVMHALVRAAVEYVGSEGGTIVEAYPTQPREKRMPPVSSYMGIPAIFAEAGFVECARPSQSRVIMRYYLE